MGMKSGCPTSLKVSPRVASPRVPPRGDTRVHSVPLVPSQDKVKVATQVLMDVVMGLLIFMESPRKDGGGAIL